MSDVPSLYCTFRAAGRLFGVPIRDVKEVTTEPVCTRIPHAPSEVMGLVNIRGHVFLALSLRRLLNLTGDGPSANRRLVIFTPAVGPAFGVMVDTIEEIVTVTADQMETLPSSDRDWGGTDRAQLVTKVCKLSEELLVVLEPRRFQPIIEKLLTVG